MWVKFKLILIKIKRWKEKEKEKNRVHYSDCNFWYLSTSHDRILEIV